MNIKNVPKMVQEMKVSERRPSFPKNVSLFGGLIQVKHVGVDGEEIELPETTEYTETPESTETTETPQEVLEDVTLTVDTIKKINVNIPAEYVDSEGYLIPVRKVDSKTFVPCDFDENGEPIEPFLTEEGNYVFYDMINEYTQITPQKVVKGAERIASKVSDASQSTRQGLKSLFGELTVELTDKLRG